KPTIAKAYTNNNINKGMKHSTDISLFPISLAVIFLYDFSIKLLLRYSFDFLLSILKKPTIAKAYTNNNINKGMKHSTDISLFPISLAVI
ncbi:hypothetical protein BOQ60_25840, partial [Chryseobacterium sp. CH1]